MELRVKVWGCRGSIATPSPLHVKYGGNTTCVEVDAGKQKLILTKAWNQQSSFM